MRRSLPRSLSYRLQSSSHRPSLRLSRAIRPAIMSDGNDGGSNPSPMDRIAALARQLLPSRPYTIATPDRKGTLTAPSLDASSQAAASSDPTVGPEIGTLSIGPDVSIPITQPLPALENRLPVERLLLDLNDPTVLENLEWMGKKWSLGEDIFLLSPPSPYSRRLALTFLSLLRLPYEYVSLHRDIGEAELLQSRSLKAGGTLLYEDGPVVRAMKQGAVLILDGAERAERNVMPLLNNILENREQNLSDGTQLVPASRVAALRAEEANDNRFSDNKKTSRFLPVHPNFRVIALGAPIPPYKGHALDPPFRSRFQARWVEGSVPRLGGGVKAETTTAATASMSILSSELATRFFEWASLLRLHGHMAQGGNILPATSRLPNVPSTTLSLLTDLAEAFPPPFRLASRAEDDGDNDATAANAKALAQLNNKEIAPTAVGPLDREPPQDGALQVHPSTRVKVSKQEALQLERIRRAPVQSLVAPSTRALLASAYPMMCTLDKDKGRLLAELVSALGLDKGCGLADNQSESSSPLSETAGEVNGTGLLGYRLRSISRHSSSMARIDFQQITSGQISSLLVPAGPLPFVPLPELSNIGQNSTSTNVNGDEVIITPRLLSMLTTMLQLHSVGRDICMLPSSLASNDLGDLNAVSALAPANASVASTNSQATSSTTTLIAMFSSLLGYPCESVYLYKDIGGQELIMRRATSKDGSTTWQGSPLLQSALDLRGKVVHLAGIDTLGPTIGSLGRLLTDRETELWSGRRATLGDSSDLTPEALATTPIKVDETPAGSILHLAPTFRLIATTSSSTSTKADWLTEEVSNMFGFVQPSPMMESEEGWVVRRKAGITDSSPSEVQSELRQVEEFARRYRTLAADPTLSLQKSRRLGTRTILRVASRLGVTTNAQSSTDLHTLISRALLTEFLPLTTRNLVFDLLEQSGIYKRGKEGAVQFIAPEFMADPKVEGGRLVFTDANAEAGRRDNASIGIPLFDAAKQDPDGLHLIPTMKSFFDNPNQSLLMREMAIDLQVLGQHVLLMGNQGTGKNKITDRVLQLLGRPREYMQLHRDSTVAQILQLVQLNEGQLSYVDSALVRGIKLGRVVVVDEADKCSAAVTHVFKSLAERGELSLPDGRRVRPPGSMGGQDDVIVHPDFRLILLANRPGFPFLGNSFLEVIGEGFSCFSVSNPDVHSEIRLLKQAAPSVPEELIRKLVLAVGDLRDAFDSQQVAYPYSLRELLHIVRHMAKYPEEDLTSVLLNVLSFDLHRVEAMQFVIDILKKRGLPVDGLTLEAVRENAQQGKGKDGKMRVSYDPKKEGKSTELDQPKDGQEDAEGKPHVGGNKWKGGSGGRDTAGMGGRGGYQRLFGGHPVHQISDELKKDVPDHIKKQAREMAREALQKKLAEEGMTSHEGATYQSYKQEMLPMTNHLVNVLNDLQANAKERTWLMRQQEGELDERRLTDGLTGERAIFKRRQEAPPEIGAPQTKPKRLRFVVDVSASMYAMQFDGRLEREIKTIVMIMEAMARVDPAKYTYSVIGHSGDEDSIPFIVDEKPPKTDGQRWKVIRDMYSHTQYTGSGDNTLRGIEKSIKDIAKKEGDDYFVIALSDAQLARYGITSTMLGKSLKASEKVKAAAIFIDRGQEAVAMTRQLPGKTYIARETKELPQVLSAILSSMVSDSS